MALNQIIKYFQNYQAITLLGFGKEGRSAYSFIRKYFPEKHIRVADINEKLKNELNPEIINDTHLTFRLGKNYLEYLDSSQLTIASPGIPLNRLGSNKAEITSQTDLILRFFRQQIIGVTGTKGKSTTSALIHHILLQAGKKSMLFGNIGSPPFDHLEEITEESYLVIEMSAHQLSMIRNSPHIAVMLNLFSEHLDHFKSAEAYFTAKTKITRYQQEDDVLIYNSEDALLRNYLKPYLKKRRICTFSLKESFAPGLHVKDEKVFYNSCQSEEQIFDSTKAFKLVGRHNISNILAASCAAISIGLPVERIQGAVESFSGLEHRLEFVGRFRQIDFYNDSIATVPEAAIAAIHALENIDTIILGGFDRGLDYGKLNRELARSEIRNIIYTGEAGKRMFEDFRKNLSNKENVYLKEFEEAVKAAIKLTRAESICLLSPAAASYDQFANFEERGKRFKKMAENT